MMTKDKEVLIEAIFSDAQVIDIDFSNWDKFISILVVADHLKSTFYNHRLPIYEIKFLQTVKISFNFNHHDDNIFIDNNDLHYQWMIDQSSIDNDKNGNYFLTLFQNNNQPKIEISFKDLETKEISPQYFDEINAKWFKPNSSLARKDIKSLYNFFIKNKKD
jgi:hypothetical protein